MATNLVINLPHSKAPKEGKEHPASFQPRRASPSAGSVSSSKKQGSLTRREIENNGSNRKRNYVMESQRKSKSDVLESLTQNIDPSRYQDDS